MRRMGVNEVEDWAESSSGAARRVFLRSLGGGMDDKIIFLVNPRSRTL